MKNIEIFVENYGISFFYFKIILGFAFSFLITFTSIPMIVKISRRKNLMDEPGARSSHIKKIPNLGGVAMFFSLGVCAPIFAYQLFETYKFLFPALVILFYVGICDDITVMRAYKKLLIQILVSVLIVVGSDVRIRSFFGLFGINELNYYVSVVFSIITFIILINAFNLIDGIDGLAGGYSVLSSALFGVSFYRLGEYNYPLVIFCAIIVGSVVAFLYYNLSIQRMRKIFMGDTGSMILGFLLAFTAINFIDTFIAGKDLGIPHYHLQTAPVIAVAILILPIIDTLSVIVIRLYQRKSVLEADKNHIHHRMIELDLTHRRSTFYICCYYLMIIGIAYFMRHQNINILLLTIFALGFIGTFLPIVIKKYRKSNEFN